MSEREIDNIFKNALDGYSKSPPADAWARLEQKRTRNNRPWAIYLGIAASISLLIIGSFFFIDLPQKDLPIADMSGLENSTSLALKNEQPDKEAPHEETKVEHQVKPFKTKEQTTLKNPKKETVPNLKTVAQSNTVTSNIHADEAKGLLDETTIASKGFSLEAVSGKSITAISPPPDNPIRQSGIEVPEWADKTDAEKPKTIKRLLEKAWELKSDNHAWASLRQAKNDLIAQGLKKERTENNE